jgi:hypothetical protein
MYEYHEALKAEIAFWQELLSDSHLSSDSPEYQRMVHAINLAEFKLADHSNTQHLQ